MERNYNDALEHLSSFSLEFGQQLMGKEMWEKEQERRKKELAKITKDEIKKLKQKYGHQK